MKPARYSRERIIITKLNERGYHKALEALFLMIDEMSIEKGFSRHDGTDYYLHLIDVAQDLMNNGIMDEDVITAALLHDAIEDVPGINSRFIADRFGKNVEVMVGLVTKDKSKNYHVDKDAMEQYLHEISLNYGAALIKTADRIHNFSSMREYTSVEHKRKQVMNTEEFFIPFFRTCRNHYPIYAHYFYGAKYSIEPTLFALKEYLALYDTHNSPEEA